MKRTRNGYTPMQWAYAQHVLSGKTKKESAILAGYKEVTANAPTRNIESTEGFANAMTELAGKAGNVALSVMHKLGEKERIDKMTTGELMEAVNVLSTAFVRFTPKEKKDSLDGNILRDIFAKQIEKQKVIDANTTE